MKNVTRIARLLGFACLVLVGASLLADDAVMDRGFKAGSQYDFHGIDAVNAFNGNLSVHIPLGQRYTTNGTLTYQFTLAYNSGLWDWLTYGSDNGTVSVREMVYSNQFIGSQDTSPGFSGSESFPARSANAGMGWTVSLGELHETFQNVRYRYEYVSEDGAAHAFYDQLHANIGNAGAPDVQTLYSRDGSYIRLVAVERSGGATSPVQLYEVQLPDGIHKRYRRTAWPADHLLDHRWLLESISDPYGNALWVQRPAVPAVGSQWTWTYREGTVAADRYVNYPSEVPLNVVRTHTVTYRLKNFYDLRVEQIGLASSAGTAYANFVYDDFWIARATGNTWADPQTIYVPFDTAHGYRVAVSLLKSVALPSNGGTWNFSYVTDTSDELPVSWPSDQTPGHFTYPVSTQEGHLSRIDYPTGGGVSYEYAGGGVPSRSCVSQRSGGSFPTVGVTRRQQWKNATTHDGDPWLYFRVAPLDQFTTNVCHLPREFLSATIDPFGKTDLTFYSIYVYNADNPTTQQWNSNEWGLSLTRYEKDSGGRLLSSRIFQCNAGTFAGAGTGAGDLVKNMLPRYAHGSLTSTDWNGTTCGGPLRSHYVSYDPPLAVDCPPDGESPCWQPNQRLLSERTVYHDDTTGPNTPEMVVDHHDAAGPSSFDGLGHFRRTQTTSSNFTFDVNRTETKSWNPTRSVTSLPTTAEPWMLETYSKTQVDEGGDSRVTIFDFAADSGFLRAKRVYTNGAGESANDVITTFQRSPYASTVTIDTKSFGGDANNVVANTGTVTQQSPEYWTETQMQYGGVAQRTVLCPPGRSSCTAGTIILTPESNTVDPNDGKVTVSHDASGLATSYAWDGLGRITSVSPMQGAPTTYAYTPYGGSSNPTKVTMTQSQGNTTYAYAEYRYDHFGRLSSEKHQFPAANGHKMNLKTSSYRPTGELEKESTTRLDDLSEPEVDLRYDTFDAFGRPGRILPADGGAAGKHTELTYQGIQAVKERVFNVATSLGAAGDNVVTWKTSDALGRLRRVEETSLPGSPHTDYTYDPAGTLKLVDMGDQKRWFTYDGRGLLKDETDPELAGVPVHCEYDSRGHMTKLRHGPGSTPFNLQYLWDPAERLLSVAPLATPNNVLKEFVYYDSNNDCDGSAGYALGKVRTAIGHNYLVDPNAPAGGTAPRIDVTVQEQFRYLGVDGRLSDVKTLVAGTEKFHTGYSYDAQGNVTQIDYPLCTGNCSGSAGTPRLQSQYYDLGALNGVTGFADSITYLPNGLVGHVHHANNVDDVTTNDDVGLPRPKTLMQMTNGFVTWKAGDFSYDAAGNIYKIGGDAFSYDASGRLTGSRVGADASGNGGVSQTFTYDRYGNLGGTTASDGNNRLIGAGYDAGGNVIQLDGYSFEFDALNRMTMLMGGQAVTKEFVYNAAGERLAVWDLRYGAAPGRLRQVWSFRDLGGHVLRDFEKLDGAWHPLEDYVYRGSSLLASVTASGVLRHFALDHLGTPRLATDGSATIKATHIYAPFGAELSTVTDGERMKFTGQERDENDPAAGTQAGDIDYMHARYYSPLRGRFLSIDPVLGKAADPQSWNRYAYVRNNPILRVDPDGKDDVAATLSNLFVQGVMHAKDFIVGLGQGAHNESGGGVLGIKYGGGNQSQETGKSVAHFAATHDTTVEATFSGANLTTGFAVVNGHDWYAIAGGTAGGVAPVSLSFSIGLVGNYTGVGSYGGPFIAQTSSMPLGVTWAANPLQPTGANSLSITVTTDVGVGASWTKYFPMSLPDPPKKP